MDFYFTPKTKCLDGTKAGYYYAPSTNGSDVWLIFIEGGGACWDTVSCAGRINDRLGSSDYWDKDGKKGPPENSQKKSDNPRFHFVNMVFIPYCTGDVHSGTLAKPGADGLWFSGHRNFGFIIKMLKFKTDIDQASRILLTGASAGGVGVINNVDYLAEQFPGIIVKGAPKAGWFFPGDVAEDREDSAMHAVNDFRHFQTHEHGGPVDTTKIYQAKWHAKCQDGLAAKNFHHQTCNAAGILYPYITVPMFILQNKFDTFQLKKLLFDTKLDSEGSLHYLKYYEKAMDVSMDAVYDKPRDGLFYPACYSHTEGLNFANDKQNSFDINGVHASDLVGDWFFLDPEEGPKVRDECGPRNFACNPSCKHTTSCIVESFKLCKSVTSKAECNTCIEENSAQLTDVGCHEAQLEEFCSVIYKPDAVELTIVTDAQVTDAEEVEQFEEFDQAIKLNSQQVAEITLSHEDNVWSNVWVYALAMVGAAFLVYLVGETAKGLCSKYKAIDEQYEAEI